MQSHLRSGTSASRTMSSPSQVAGHVQADTLVTLCML